MTRYAGGKYRLGRHIADSIDRYENMYDYCHGVTQKRDYFEPFVGMCGVMRHIKSDRKRIGCDLNLDVIAMWKALQRGWVPPMEVTEEEYNNLRDNVPEGDPSRGIVAHGASWGGYFFSKSIYCDSPYADSIGATGKKSRFLNQFDHERFWENVRHLCKENLVFVSEGTAPKDFKPIWEKETLSRMAGKGIEKRRVRNERLYVHESQYIEGYV